MSHLWNHRSTCNIRKRGYLYKLSLHQISMLISSSRIAEIENQIGGGLIEEVIQVAEGELKLAAIMSKSKVSVF